MSEPKRAVFHWSYRDWLLDLTAADALAVGIDSATEIYLVWLVGGTAERLHLPCFAIDAQLAEHKG